MEKKRAYTLWVQGHTSDEPLGIGSAHRRGPFENRTEGIGGICRLYRLFSLYRLILMCRMSVLYWLIPLSNTDRFQRVYRLIWRM